MKNILALLITMALSLSIHASENPFQESLQEFSMRIQSDVNPFKEGTEKFVLTEQDKQTLTDYALNSKVLLERALRKAQGKTIEEIYDLYVGTIKKVVIDSFADKKRSELLMRYALNQALQLTVGIPTADGTRIQTKGVLADISNQDVINTILEDSMRLAIRYYQDDIKAIQSGELVNLPYIAFGNERLNLAQSWSHTIHQSDLLLKFQVAMLEQWMTTVANNEVLDRIKIGEAILDVDQALVDVKSTDYSTAKKIRFLRGVIDELFIVLRKLGYQISERTNPVLSETTFSELLIVIDLNEVDGHENLRLKEKRSLDLVIGQGYTGRFFYKEPNYWTQPDRNGKLKGPYKSKSAEELIVFMKEYCDAMQRDHSVRTVCAPVQKIPKANEYMKNEDFQENFTVPFEIGIFEEAYESPVLE